MSGSGIYEILHVDSGKRYIGSAKNFQKRWNIHRHHLRQGTHHSPHLQRSWSKYGDSGFEFSILEKCQADHLLLLEQVWMDWCKPEFNVCPKAHNTSGRKFSEETKQKMSAARIGSKMPPRTEEYRQKMSLAQKGKPKAAHVIAALQVGRKAQVFTAERRASVSQALREAYESGLRNREKSEAHKYKIGQFYAKLSDEQVREIRKLRAEGVTCTALAAQFDSNAGTICAIAKRKRYRWVD